MMIPRTTDGRVLFAIPWHERLMVGTTDVAANGPTWTPEASEAEIEFILDTARSYLQTAPSAGDVRATFAGLRPLFSPRAAQATKKISREHAIVIERQNLVTVIGGKWTTYRKMALDALDQAARAGLLDARPCTSADIELDVDDSIEAACSAAEASALAGGSSAAIASYVRLAARHEQAHSADDVIARRLRVESLDRAVASQLKPTVEAALAARSPQRQKKATRTEWP